MSHNFSVFCVKVKARTVMYVLEEERERRKKRTLPKERRGHLFSTFWQNGPGGRYVECQPGKPVSWRLGFDKAENGTTCTLKASLPFAIESDTHNIIRDTVSWYINA